MNDLLEDVSVLFTADRPFLTSNDKALRNFVPFQTSTAFDDGLPPGLPKSTAEKKKKLTQSITVSEGTTMKLFVHCKAITPTVGLQCTQSLHKEKSKKPLMVVTEPLDNLAAPFYHVLSLPPVTITKKQAASKTLMLCVRVSDSLGNPVLEQSRSISIDRAEVTPSAKSSAALPSASSSSSSSSAEDATLNNANDLLFRRTIVAGPILLFQGEGAEQRPPPAGAKKVPATAFNPPTKDQWNPHRSIDLDARAALLESLSAAPVWSISLVVALKEPRRKEACEEADAPSLLLPEDEGKDVYRTLLHSRDPDSLSHSAVHLWRFDFGLRMADTDRLVKYGIVLDGKQISGRHMCLRVPAAKGRLRLVSSAITSPSGVSADRSSSSVIETLYENQTATLAHLCSRNVQEPQDLLLLDLSSLLTNPADAHELVRRLFPYVEHARLNGMLSIPPERDWRVSGAARPGQFDKNTWFHRHYANMRFGEAEKAEVERQMFDMFLERFAEPHLENLLGTIPVVPHLPLDMDLLPRENNNVILRAMLGTMSLFLIGAKMDKERHFNTLFESAKNVCFPRLCLSPLEHIQDAMELVPDPIKPAGSDVSTCGFLSFIADEDTSKTDLKALPTFGNHELALAQLRMSRGGRRSSVVLDATPSTPPPPLLPLGASIVASCAQPVTDADLDACNDPAGALGKLLPKDQPALELRLGLLRSLLRLRKLGYDCTLMSSFGSMFFEADSAPFRVFQFELGEDGDESSDSEEEAEEPKETEEAKRRKSKGSKVNGPPPKPEFRAMTVAASEIKLDFATEVENVKPSRTDEQLMQNRPDDGPEEEMDEEGKDGAGAEAAETSGAQDESGDGDANENEEAGADCTDTGEGGNEGSDKEAEKAGGESASVEVSPSAEGDASDPTDAKEESGSEEASAGADEAGQKEGEDGENAAKRSSSKRSQPVYSLEDLRSNGTTELPPAPCVVHHVNDLAIFLPFKTVYQCPAAASVWAEAETGPWNLVYSSTPLLQYEIRAAKLTKLIQVLTSPPSDIRDTDAYKHFVSLFFMTYRAFADPLLVLTLIIERYYPPVWADTHYMQERLVPALSRIRHGVCTVLVHWFTEHYQDFTSNKKLLHKLRSFIHFESQATPDADDSLPSSIPVLRGMVSKKEQRGTYESMYDPSVIVENPETPILPEKFDQSTTFMMLNELEIARQLTIAEFHIYVQIKPVEMQNLAWSKPKLKHTAPNILHLINHFNVFSMQCVSMIVMSETLRERKLVIEKLVNVANHLMELRSYNMAMAIKAAFNHACVHRLKFTFQGLPKTTLKMANALHSALSTENNNAAIRRTVSQASPPCIPFLGIYLSDLTFVEDGNPDYIHNGLINFRKRVLEYDVIRQILAFKDRSYALKLVPKITAIIDKLPALEETEIRDRSLALEPRGAQKKDIK